MNPLTIGGIVLIVLAILIFVAPDSLNYIVAVAFLLGGGYLAYTGTRSA